MKKLRKIKYVKMYWLMIVKSKELRLPIKTNIYSNYKVKQKHSSICFMIKEENQKLQNKKWQNKDKYNVKMNN